MWVCYFIIGAELNCKLNCIVRHKIDVYTAVAPSNGWGSAKNSYQTSGSLAPRDPLSPSLMQSH